MQRWESPNGLFECFVDNCFFFPFLLSVQLAVQHPPLHSPPPRRLLGPGSSCELEMKRRLSTSTWATCLRALCCLTHPADGGEEEEGVGESGGVGGWGVRIL